MEGPSQRHCSNTGRHEPHGWTWDADEVWCSGSDLDEVADQVFTHRVLSADDNERRAELANWWLETAQAEVAGLLAKMGEYGGAGAAIDLIEIGRTLELVAGSRLTNSASAHAATTGSDAWMAELGCYFYLVGKMARWTAAVMEGRPVSDDTLMDIGIYTRMVQRIRRAGGWPNA